MAMMVLATLLAGVSGMASSTTAMSVSSSGRPYVEDDVERVMEPQSRDDYDYRGEEAGETEDRNQKSLREQEVASMIQQDIDVPRTNSLKLIEDGAETRDAVEGPPPSASYDTFSLMEAAEAAEAAAGAGAPDDGYTTCANEDEECTCKDGEVRWGAVDDNIWTMPTKIGEAETVQCKLAKIQEKRVHYTVQDGNEEPLGCQCVERTMKISIDMGLSAVAKSLLEKNAKDLSELIQMESKGGERKCLVPSTGSSLIETAEDAEYGSFAQRQRTGAGESVLIEECVDGDDQEWTFHMSTGQIKHMKSGLCLSVDWTGGTRKEVTLHECTGVENQERLQRWEAPMYIMPNFKSGEGVIRLGYGGHTDNAICLMTAGEVVYTELCSSDAISEWIMRSIDLNGHAWKTCGAEDQECNCPHGEVRYGDGEKNIWTPGVPIQTSIQCSLPTLQAASLPGAMATGGVCQCRHDLIMDGNGDVKETAKQKAKEDADDMKKLMGSPITPIVGGALILGLITAGGVIMMKRKQQGLLDGEEYDGEEEYEEEEEEEE